MKNKLHFRWEEVLSLWWMLVVLLIMCGSMLIVIKKLPDRSTDLSIVEKEDQERAPIESDFISDRSYGGDSPNDLILVDGIKGNEDTKKAETVETANTMKAVIVVR